MGTRRLRSWEVFWGLGASFPTRAMLCPSKQLTSKVKRMKWSMHERYVCWVNPGWIHYTLGNECYWDRNFQVMQEIREVLAELLPRVIIPQFSWTVDWMEKFASIPEWVCFTLFLSSWCWWFYFKVVLRVCWNALGVRFIFSWFQSKVRWEEILTPQ